MNWKEALDKKVWAVVGATPKKEKFGYRIFALLKKRGYEVYPIHPVAKEIDGEPCYTSLQDIPAKVQVVDFVVGRDVGLNVLDECKKVGVETVWLQPGADHPDVVQKARELGLNVVQDCVLICLN